MLKVLHTSDWHLGQRLLLQDRREEHELALEWLLQTIKEQAIDVLLVAGDIFDIGNPPNHARELYYRFITALRHAGCRHLIITGGNHDSPGMLDAPKELLRMLDIHVVGAASGDLRDEIIELKNQQGQLEAVVAAIPFLRDRDLRQSVAGESGKERLDHVRHAIRAHFLALAKEMESYTTAEVPIIAMGHLHATGAKTSGKQQPIYVGNIENLDAGQFPDLFDYVALGHIHRPQAVGKQEHIRYSGSLIPLDFSETKDDKSVYVLHFAGRECQHIETLKLPIFRRLKTIQGSLEEVKEKLTRFAAKPDRSLRPWVEVLVTTDRIIPQLDVELRDFCKDLPFDLLSVRLDRHYHSISEAIQEAPDLDDLSVEEVFRERCSSYGSPPDEMEELMLSFQELRSWWQEEEEKQR